MARNRILIQYSIVSLIIFLFVSIFYGLIIDSKRKDYLIRTHINIFQNVITQYIEEYPSILSFLSSSRGNSHGKEAAVKLFSNILRKKGILQVNLLNSHNQVVWNNTGSAIIRKEFQDNHEYLEALNGVVAYNVGETDKAGNADDAVSGWFLKIYIPVINQGKVAGIVEIHELETKLKLSNDENRRNFLIITLSANFLLYVLLFYIFYRANRAQSVMMKTLEQTQDVTIFALAYQAELRDNETGKHLDRTASYVKILAQELRKNEENRYYLTDEYISDLAKSAPLHDIGKVGIPDLILKKPGSLTIEEFEIIKKHSGYGVEILVKASSRLSVRSFLDIAIQLVGSHHEKWDGTGYPKGLSKDSIPISGRIMALADVYDALRSRRVYKDSFPHDNCVKIISDESGKHFDPLVVKAFLLHEQEFFKISELYDE